ncbi:MAG: DMT family transporter [Sulfolobales archaeon]|nr:DMT family transporter [Sulfolobales archaeon]MCX8198898.1 DMT family transporter [Sulfolobales archaeon]MDW8170817.1 DMT family transporter [Desulfurococcaceae archaeon]
MESILVIAALSLIAALSISSASILVLLSKADALGCVFWRLLITSLLLTSYASIHRGELFKRIACNRQLLKASALSGLALFTHFTLWMESLFYIPVSYSTTIVVTYPMQLILLDAALREAPSKRQVVGIVCGFSSLLLLLTQGVFEALDLRGVAYSLLASIAASAYFGIGRVVRRRGLSVLEYVIPTYGFASLIALLYALIIGRNLLSYSLHSYAFFTLMSLAPMIGGHTVINYLLKYLKSSIATSIALIEPVGASILAYLLLGQEVSMTSAILMIMVVTSICLVVLSKESI